MHTPKGALQQWRLLSNYVFFILPRVEKQLAYWRHFLEDRPPTPLIEQALASIKGKHFHCQGGAVFALLAPQSSANLLQFIVSFQTISDYLDNLCDRVTCPPVAETASGNAAAPGPGIHQGHAFKAAASTAATPAKAGPESTSAPAPRCSSSSAATKDLHEDYLREKSYSTLHRSLFAALQPGDRPGADYNFYRHFPAQKDGGYLEALVSRAQQAAGGILSCEKIGAKVNFLTALYSELQSLKHLSRRHRQRHLQEWFRPYEKKYPSLLWNEFAAAAGSTLGTFVLLAHGSRPGSSDAETEKVFGAYFPWICALHILLDYYIDQEEDCSAGDLNFISYYEDSEHCRERLKFFVRSAMQRAGELPDPVFHQTVVKGLLALYLSDPKIKGSEQKKTARELMAATGCRDTAHLHRLCLLLRRCGII